MSAMTAMEQRVSMIMVGTRDIAAQRRFYEAGLGWQPWAPPTQRSVSYSLGSGLVVFLDADYLAAESGVPAGPNPVALAHFVGARAEVDALFGRAVAAGARVTSPVRERDGGIYSGYFADGEGNTWEIAWSATVPVATYDRPGAPASGR
jgi:catechol 2,3-dioxygenase-like lactoylglutathione lyase family enzyme